MSDPVVTAVVVTYNSAATIRACLASLRDESRRVALETIVADNASGDTTLAMVRGDFPEARVVALSSNRGFAAACNAGAAEARGRFLLFVNPDARLRPLAAVEMLRVLAREPSIGVAGPRIVGLDGRAELSWGPLPGFLGEAWQKAAGSVPLARAWVERQARRERAVDWVSGACLLVPRAVYEEAAGFDEHFFLYFEDADLCARIRASGHRILFTPRAEVVHARGASVAAARRRGAVEYRRSQVYFYHKHHGADAARLLAALLRVKLTAAEVVAVLRRRPEAAALASEVRAALRGQSNPQGT